MHRRLLFAHLAVTVLVLLMLEVPLGLFFAERERQRLTADVERDATVLASLYEDVLERRQPLDVRAANTYAERTGARVVVVDADGIARIDTEAAVPRDFSTRPEIAAALAGQRAEGSRPSATLDTDLLYVAVPSASGGKVHGAVRLTIPTSEVDGRIRRFWLSLAAVGGVVLLAVSLVSRTLSRSVVRPVTDLTTAAERIATGDLSVRIDVRDAPNELVELAGSFNTMADRLEVLLGAQRSFVADASHQLRTPLTALRLRLENAEADSLDASTQADLRLAIVEVERMADLVSQLLDLARAEGRRVTAAAVEFRAIAAERLDLWQSVASDRNIELVLDPGDELVALATPGSVEQILDNLLDNAIRASPAGGQVRVGATATDTLAELRVTDQGPGLDDTAKQRAFDRFWRGSSDRSGTGLGLAIVRTLAEQSGGTAALVDAPSGGLTATVRLRRVTTSRSPAASVPDPGSTPTNVGA
jgi:signal transduction histidine kinase